MSKKAFVSYVESIGFSGVSFTKLYADKRVAQLEFEELDPKVVRKRLGKSTIHAKDKFVWRVSRDRAIRVNTRINRIWVGNSKQMVQRFLESI